MTGVAVKIGADTSGLEDAVKRSKSALSDLSGEMRQGITTAAKYATAAAAAGAAIFTGLAVKGLEAVDAQAKLARQLGATNDGLRATQIAAQDAGISSGELTSSLQALNARIGEAQRGSGAAAASFERLGLDAQKMASMDVDQRMAHIADRMKEMGLSTSQAGDELRQMGIRNQSMINLMMQGGDAIRDARQEVDDLGLSLSAIDAAKVEAANDSFARIGMILQTVSQTIAIELAPILDAVSKMFTSAAKEAGGLGKSTSDAFKFIVDSAAFVISAVDGIKRAFEVVADGVIAAFSWMADKIAAAIEGVIKIVDKVPGIDMTESLASIEEFRRVSQHVTREAMDNIADTLNQPLKGEAFKVFVEEAREAAELAAEATVAASEMMRDQFLLQEEHNEALLQQKEEHEAEMTEAERRAAKMRQDIADAEAETKKRILSNAFKGLTSLMNSESRKMFEIGKTAAIANSMVATYQGMTEALKLGWPLGPIAAAAIGATGFANVASIRSQSFGSGGGAAGSVTQQISGNNAPVQQQQSQSIMIRGFDPSAIYSGAQVQQLVGAIEGFWQDGGGMGRIILGGQ